MSSPRPAEIGNVVTLRHSKRTYLRFEEAYWNHLQIIKEDYPLHYAMLAEEPDLFRWLLKDPNVDVNKILDISEIHPEPHFFRKYFRSFAFDGAQTVLRRAASDPKYGQWVLELLTRADIDPNACSPLWRSMGPNYDAMLQLLEDRRVNLTRVDFNHLMRHDHWKGSPAFHHEVLDHFPSLLAGVDLFMERDAENASNVGMLSELLPAEVLVNIRRMLMDDHGFVDGGVLCMVAPRSPDKRIVHECDAQAVQLWTLCTQYIANLNKINSKYCPMKDIGTFFISIQHQFY